MEFRRFSEMGWKVVLRSRGALAMPSGGVWSVLVGAGVCFSLLFYGLIAEITVFIAVFDQDQDAGW